jgi:low temperature requirement protein LtrA
MWAIGIVVSFGPLRLRTREAAHAPAVDEHHLLERMGALTIIVCGEAFVKVAIAVSSGKIDNVDIVALAFEFVLAFAIWTSYFEDVPHAGLRPGRLSPWLALHLLLQIGIAGTAVGVASLVTDNAFDHLPASQILEITATLAAVYLALGLIGPCTRRRPTAPLLVLRLATCAVTLVVGFVAWGVSRVDLVEGVAALTAVAIAHAAIGVVLESDTEVGEAPATTEPSEVLERA